MQPYRLASCCRYEYLALAAIRTARSSTPDNQDSFAALAGWARVNKLAILPADAPLLGTDEVHLLAYIARAQRRHDPQLGQLRRELRAIVEACAKDLSDRSIMLPYRTIQRSIIQDRRGAADMTFRAA